MEAVPDTAPLDEAGEDPLGLGAEYSVIALAPSALTLAYLAFAAVFGWFELYFWIWKGPWTVAVAGALVLASAGTVAAWKAHAARRGFATLVALLLDGGLVVALGVPILAFLVVLYRP